MPSDFTILPLMEVSVKSGEGQNMRTFVKQLAAHQFFKHCAFSDSRFTFDHVAAQLTAIELNGGPCNVKNSNLNSMYEDQLEFDPTSAKAKKIKKVLDYLLETFPEKTPELERYSVMSLYSLVSHCMERYVIQEHHKDLANWFLAFEARRAAEEELPEDTRDSEFLSYKERTSHSTDAQDSLEWRQDFLLRKFFEQVPDIQPKDNQRLFSHEQRLAIFRRDQGLCRVKAKCDGVKCEWDAWEADHITAWSRGGKTTVANGQVACFPCNASKGDRSSL